MLKAHLENLLTYFTYSISNALTEGFNSKIQSLKHAARGFRTFGKFFYMQGVTSLRAGTWIRERCGAMASRRARLADPCHWLASKISQAKGWIWSATTQAD